MGDPHLAEDATQETFLRAWKALPSFHHDGDLTHWLRRIARNHCHDLWRASERDRFMTAGGELPADVEDPRAEDAVAAATDRVALRAVLRNLRVRDAELLVDHHAVGISVGRLAQRWKMTKGAMEVALHRARQRARRSAEDLGLRGLIPVDALRRLAIWSQRSAADFGGIGSSAAAALCNLAVVAMIVAVPQLGAPGASRPTAPGNGRQTAAVPAGALQPSPAAPRLAAAPDDLEPAVADHMADAAPPARRDQPVTDVAPVPLPTTDEALPGTEGGPKQDGRIGIHDPTAKNRHMASVTFSSEKGEASGAVLGQLRTRGCPAVETARPAASCH